MTLSTLSIHSLDMEWETVYSVLYDLRVKLALDLTGADGERKFKSRDAEDVSSCKLKDSSYLENLHR